MLIVNNGTTLEVTFGSPLGFQDAIDPIHYRITTQAAGAVPVGVQSVALRYTTIQSGFGFILSDFDSQVARMPGAAFLSANATVTTIAPNASMVGSASVTAAATVIAAAQATMAGGSNLSASPELPTVDMGGAASLSASPTVQMAIQATMTGSATVVALSPPTTAAMNGDSQFLAELSRVQTEFTRFFYPYGATLPFSVGDFISLQSAANNVPFARVIQIYADGTLRLDRELLLLDPDNGMIAWTHHSALEGVDLTINKPTNGKLYTLRVNDLRALTGEVYSETDDFTAVSGRPQVISAEQLDEGQIVVSFSDTMRVDQALIGPSEYAITGPTPVLVKTVRTVTPTQVLLTTVGLADGAYTLMVNATGTPHDIAGNPIDPTFNQAIFSGSPALSSRSVYVDRGPITKPALTLQAGATATITSPTQITLPTANILPAHVGLYLTLTGTLINAGTFRITTRVSATVVRVGASFSLPDAANGAIGWGLVDPRNGEIADDPSDVVVRVNSVPVTAEAVIGLLGQIVLPSVPAPTDTVDVDYSWVCNPVVDFRRLNSQEFRLNNWNRDNNRPTDPGQHKYRFNNTLIQPETFVPLDIRAELNQPLQRDLKYRAYERAYSVALNDPNLLLLNSPNHRIAFPPMSRSIETTFVNYQGTVLPEASPAAPWERHGSGTAMIVGTDLVVVDASSGPFPNGNPIFWTRTIDLTFSHVFAIAWRMMIDSAPTSQGVFTGIAAGYSDASKAVVIGFLDDAGIKKVGVLKAGSGNDPSAITAWTGGLDGSGNPTGAPVALDWSLLHSYRVFRDRSGVIRFFVDGSIVPALQVLPDELPFLEELNAPFNELQGAFFGSLSREAENTSTWSFVRYTAIPINPFQTAPSIYVSYEGDTPPEAASQPWTPVGFHGTETIIADEYLLLDSTSATDLPSEVAAGLISGDFRGYSRIEPLLSESFNTVLDVNVALRTFTHGITPNAVLAAIDDGDRLIQLCFFPDQAAPKFSYGGRALPNEFAPYLWNQSGGATPTMVGQYLRIDDTSNVDGLVYFLDDLEVVASPNRVIGSLSDYMLEFRAQVLSYTPDITGYAGAMTSVYDSLRSVGLMLQDVAGTRYVTLHSDGIAVVGGQFAFDWFDGEFHTYRASKSTGGNLVSLFIDGLFVGAVAYSNFAVPAPLITGLVSFGSATPLSVQSQSSVLWAYSNYWRVNSVRKYVGIWKGTDSTSLTGYHLPLRAAGRMATVAGNTLTDMNGDFVTKGVLVGDRGVIDNGPNKGVYNITAVSPTALVVSSVFPSQPSGVDYRVVIETDWTVQHQYRIVKDPSGGVSVFLDAATAPLIHANYSNVDLPSSTLGIARTIASGLPSILWGAFDPTNVSQTSWDYVRLGAVRSIAEMGIVPHHQILNQRNIMASFEHHRTIIPHTHTDFWSESEGIPPQTEPDLLRDPDLTAYTLLNDRTPLVPSTQTYEVRKPTPVLVPVSALNRPEDVLGSQAFLLNDSSQRIEIIVPDDVLYNCLEVIERTTGDLDLIAPFDDECQPSFGPLFFQNTVCLTYDGTVLPENDPTAATPWTRVSDNPAHQFATAFAGVLTYGTDATGTRTTYRNNSPLPDSIGLQTEVKFRLRLLQDSTGGLGDSQVRMGFSSPGLTIGLAFVTTPLGERYVLVVDLNNGRTVGGIPFDFYDGSYHDYRLVRDPGTAMVQIFIDS